MTDDDSDVLTARDKGLPMRAVGMTVGSFLATGPRLDEFWTPLVVLDDAAMRANVATMAQWCAQRGIDIFPHGKTTMAPALWRRQLDAGARGITLATMGQVRAGRERGLTSIMLANADVDPRSLAWLSGELVDPRFHFVSWADSVDTVDAMEHGLRSARAPRPVDVCVELGAMGARTGARTVADGVRVAERIARSDMLRLAGVAGYEGSIGHDRSDAVVSAIRTYLEAQLDLHDALAELYDDGELLVTAGGSAYFDIVADVWSGAPRDGRTRFALRSGAYIVHDDGFYRGISPFDEGATAPSPRFRNAMHGLVRVVSSPEPGLALGDGGKRDLPYDEGLPLPRAAASDLDGPWHAVEGSVSAMNDQHSYLRTTERLPVGSVVRLGLSHPCTAFDKWRVLPVVDSIDDGAVVDLVRTYF